jgi:ATP-dependent protease ClpP protease subunit
MNTLTTGHVTFSLHPEHMGMSYSGVLDLLGACDLVDLSQIASSYYGYSRVEVRFISPGGLTSGMNTVASVFDALRKRGVTVATSAFGLTASAAAVLLSYGDLGERRVQAGTTLLYHHPRVEAEVVTSSSARDLQAQLAAAGRDVIDKLAAWIVPLASSKGGGWHWPLPGQDDVLLKLAGIRAQNYATESDCCRAIAEGLERLFELDRQMSPDTACRLGLADEIV